MIGVRDLTRHILYIAKKEGYEESKFYKTGLEKVVFMAFCYLLKNDVQIRYDILFYKSHYGATSNEVRDIFGERYGRHISYEAAKRIENIDYDGEINQKIVDMVKLEANNTFSVVPYIVNSHTFKESEYNKLKEEGMSNDEYDYKVWCRDESVIWTLAEIYLLANVNVKDDTDLRIPLKEKEYNAMMKYIKLRRMCSNDEKSELSFTFDEILTLRCMSDSIIESVQKNGAYLLK